MKKLKGLKKLNNSIEDLLEEMRKVSKLQINSIKKEYQKKVFEERLQLISEIANGEDIDELTLKNKYLYNKKSKSNIEKPKIVDSEKSLLNVLTYNDEDYYYEDHEGGKVFNTNSESVGIYIEGNIVFDSS